MLKDIAVFDFVDAPAAYKKLSGHGGDEDFIVFVPRSVYVRGYPTYDWIRIVLEREWRGHDYHIVPGGFIDILAHA